MIKKISKNQIKEFASLQQKKKREEKGLFVAEGEKIVKELLESDFNKKAIIATGEWIKSNSKFLKNIETFEADTNELAKISSLKTPNNVITIVEKKENRLILNQLNDKLSLVLDDVQDPGNFGTIIRLADWFGIENIICSQNTVELYNPKVIQATMGALLRVNIFYTNIELLLEQWNQKSDFPIYGAFLQGKSIYNTPLKSKGFIVLGNESKGISEKIETFVKEKISIPNYSKKAMKTESLNVSVAAAIICAEFQRQNNI